MTYANAPAAALVATHCCLCGRELVDAPSVECGMGPTCRARVLRDIRGKRVSVTLSWNGCVIVGAPQNAASTVRINPSDVVIGRAVFAKWAKTLPAEFVAAHDAVKSLSSDAADAHLEALAAEHAARGIAPSVEVLH